ncbi:hypothetical protein OG596_26475 [Streptomyces sp. NBC_01102]|uniref:hypothetical protein n=1 Tax=Streptomyces sp. NBC_01102 TaxID=2903749 RepID=UPI0038640F79|nr:hypothetical protein OG596_26475 [Streptomyces sp. NBC_01102]
MTEQPRLHHLLDRARRGVILPAEGEQLAVLVGEMEAENDQLRDALAHCRHKPRVTELEAAIEQAELDAEQQARHFKTLSGERESYRQAWKDEQKHRATAEAEVARLTAGQCTCSLAMCEQHHAQPVATCPYPRCLAAQKRATEQHPFEQHPDAPASTHVCRCGKWPDHHIHTSNTTTCGCDTCRATETNHA